MSPREGVEQRTEITGRAASLGRLARDVDLHERLQRATSGLGAPVELGGELGPIDRVNDARHARDHLRFVALDRPDRVPAQVP